MLGLESTARASIGGTTKFADVNAEIAKAADYWAAGYIKIASDKGIIVGYGDGNFGPDDKVTFQDAVKMIVCALGYNTRAQQNGGYPTGYLIEGIGLKVSNNMSFSGTSEASRGTIALLLYNSLEVDLMKEVVWSSDPSIPPDLQIDQGKNVLNSNLQVNKYSGMIIATENAAFSGSTANKGQVRVQLDYDVFANSTNQHAGIRAMNLGDVTLADANAVIGQKVYVYFNYDNVSNSYTLILTTLDKTTGDILAIDVSNFDSLESTTSGTARFNYWIDKENDSTPESVDIATDKTLTVVMNNKTKIANRDDVTLAELVNDFSADNGMIKLLDNNNDNIYETIVVDTYRNYQVTDIDSVNYKVSLNYEDNAGVEQDTSLEINTERKSNTMRFEIYQADGTPADFSAISDDSVLSIYADTWDQTDLYPNDPNYKNGDLKGATLFRIYISDDTLTGTVTEIGKKTVSIDGDSYDYSCMRDRFNLDDEGTFYLDFQGEVAFVDTTTAKKEVYLLYNASTSGGTVTINVITPAGDLQTLTSQTSSLKIVNYPFKTTTSGSAISAVDTRDYTFMNLSRMSNNDLNSICSFLKDAAVDSLPGYTDTTAGGLLATAYGMGGAAPVTLKFSSDRVTTITFPKFPATNDNDFAFWTKGTETSNFRTASNILGSYVVDNSTLIFDLQQPDPNSFDETLVNVTDKTALKDSTNYKYSIFNVGKYGVAKVIMLFTSNNEQTVKSPISVIKSVTSAKNDKGDNIYKLYMIQNGADIVENTSADYGNNRPTGAFADEYGFTLDIEYGQADGGMYRPYMGQVIMYTLNSKNEIDNSNLIRVYPRARRINELINGFAGATIDLSDYYVYDYFEAIENNFASPLDTTQINNTSMFIIYGEVADKTPSQSTLSIDSKYISEKGVNGELDTFTADNRRFSYAGANITVVDTTRTDMK